MSTNKKMMGGQDKSNPNQPRDPSKNPQHDPSKNPQNPQKPYGQNNQNKA